MTPEQKTSVERLKQLNKALDQYLEEHEPITISLSRNQADDLLLLLSNFRLAYKGASEDVRSYIEIEGQIEEKLK